MASADQFGHLYGWIFGWFRMHPIFIARRTVSHRATKCIELNSRFLQLGRHVHCYQNVSLFGSGMYF